jgi:hypothetical protein
MEALLLKAVMGISRDQENPGTLESIRRKNCAGDGRISRDRMDYHHLARLTIHSRERLARKTNRENHKLKNAPGWDHRFLRR